MDKIRDFMKKHCIISLLIALLFALFVLNVFVWIVKWFFTLLGNGIELLFKYLMEIICTKEYWEQLIDMCNVTQIRVINAVLFYLALCFLFVMALAIFAIIMVIVIGCLEGCINRIDGIILGKKHQKSLEYQGFTLWYIKCKADISYFLDWVRFDILKVRYSFGEDATKIKWVRKLSLENIISMAKNVIKFFFSATTVHLILGLISLYIYYKTDILLVCESLVDTILQSGITPSQFLEMFEVLVVLCLLGYIIFDIRHKANGYSELRAERFKELVQMEEKLLNILGGISCSLEKNIDTIAERKCFILQSGASELSGKQCYIDKTKIEFEDKNKFGYWYSDDRMRQLSNLDDMKEEFQKLSELEEEFKKSALSRSNIYLIDHQTMLTRVVHFWIPGIDDKEYKRMEFFCKSSMEKWYKNRFIKPVENDNGEVRYYSESQTTKEILDVSAMLDYELMRAFWLELYLKKYERKMIKRFKRINKFSRFNLN